MRRILRTVVACEARDLIQVFVTSLLMKIPLRQDWEFVLAR